MGKNPSKPAEAQNPACSRWNMPRSGGRIFEDLNRAANTSRRCRETINAYILSGVGDLTVREATDGSLDPFAARNRMGRQLAHVIL